VKHRYINFGVRQDPVFRAANAHNTTLDLHFRWHIEHRHITQILLYLFVWHHNDKRRNQQLTEGLITAITRDQHVQFCCAFTQQTHVKLNISTAVCVCVCYNRRRCVANVVTTIYILENQMVYSHQSRNKIKEMESNRPLKWWNQSLRQCSRKLWASCKDVDYSKENDLSLWHRRRWNWRGNIIHVWKQQHC